MPTARHSPGAPGLGGPHGDKAGRRPGRCLRPPSQVRATSWRLAGTGAGTGTGTALHRHWHRLGLGYASQGLIGEVSDLH